MIDRRMIPPSSSDSLLLAYAAAECCNGEMVSLHLRSALTDVVGRRQRSDLAPFERIHQLLVLAKGVDSLRRDRESLSNASFITLKSQIDASSPTFVKALAIASRVTNILPRLNFASPTNNFEDWQMIFLRMGEYEKCAAQSASRPSFSSAASIVALGRGDDAAVAAVHLTARRKQWRSFESSDVLLLHELSRHFGLRGSAVQTSRFLKNCSVFYTPSLMMGRIVEATISGVCDRAFRIATTAARGEPVELSAPSLILQIALSFVGSDLNKDALLSLIDGIARLKSPVTVALVAKIIRAIESSDCFAISCSNEPIHFRRHAYKSLCETSPDLGRHFLMSWEATERELTSTSLATEHWSCLSCGKSNNVRYSFCSCSAIQYGLTTCEHCNFAQDQRNKNCLVCSRSLDVGTAPPQALKNWRCNNCFATNHAFQLYQCGRCNSPSDLCVSLHNNQATCPPSCGCPSSDVMRPVSQQPFCTRCGHRESWFSNHASHFTWFCGTCVAYHSWTDAVCPTFGNTERAQYTPCRRWEDTVVCPSCNFALSSPFVVACHNCGDDIRAVGAHDHNERIGAMPGSRHGVALACNSCTHVNFNARASDQCEKCSTRLHDAELTSTRSCQCPNCGYSTNEGLGVFCERCGELALTLDDDRHTQYFERCGWMNVVPSFASLGTGGKTPLIASAVLEKFTQVCRALDTCPPAVAKRIDAHLQTIRAHHLQQHDIASRRVISLCLQILDVIFATNTPPPPGIGDHRRCGECGGSHPSSTCAFTKRPWVCQTCEAPQLNNGLSRYWCPNCYEMRPEIAALVPDEAWSCIECGKLNLDLEVFCVGCGCNRDCELTGASTRIPLIPSQCNACSITYLEAVCPRCGEDPSSEVTGSTSDPAVDMDDGDAVGVRMGHASSHDVPQVRAIPLSALP
ncbi:Hypothetical protein, putative, partial [Bodo saltans]